MDLSIVVDTHAHLDMSTFNKDCGEVVARTGKSGVSTIICVDTKLDSSKKYIQLTAEGGFGTWGTLTST